MTTFGQILTTRSIPNVYVALLSQSGTDAPVATVLENTLGGTVVITRDWVEPRRGDNDSIIVETGNNFSDRTLLADPNTSYKYSLEIRVYP